MNSLQIAKETIQYEIEALHDTISSLGSEINKAVDIIYHSEGKLIISGLGKSGIIGMKLAATFSSTGTPAIFLHPVDALHGDLGIVQKCDSGLLLSNSGETKEIVTLLENFKRFGMKTIVIVGNTSSTLAQYSDIVINAHVKKEACPLNLAPTSSTIVAMAIGDALAACLIHKRGFTEEDFSMLHPSGSLGNKLILKVSDIMQKGNSIPIIKENALMSEALVVLTNKAMGAVIIVSNDSVVTGIFTDGDLKRIIQKDRDFLTKKINSVMSANPITIQQKTMAAEALSLMENRPSQISVLPVVDEENKIAGILRLHDLVKAGF